MMKKYDFLEPYLKMADNLPLELYIDNPHKPEKGDYLSLWEQKIISEKKFNPDNTVLTLKEKQGAEGIDKDLSTETRFDRIQQENRSMDDIFGYSIQVNSYKQKTNAYDLIKQLKKHNYESYFSEVYNPLTKETYYRVFVREIL